MNYVIYVRQNKDIPIYQQYNSCAEYAKRYGYSIKNRVLDFEGKIFHEAINLVIANNEVSGLIIYSKYTAFDNDTDYLFYRIYLEKLGKKLIIVK